MAFLELGRISAGPKDAVLLARPIVPERFDDWGDIRGVGGAQQTRAANYVLPRPAVDEMDPRGGLIQQLCQIRASLIADAR